MKEMGVGAVTRRGSSISALAALFPRACGVEFLFVHGPPQMSDDLLAGERVF